MSRLSFTCLVILLVISASAWSFTAGQSAGGYQIRSSQVTSLVGTTGSPGQPYFLGGMAGQPIVGRSEAEGVYSVEAGYSSLTASPDETSMRQLFLPMVQR